MIVIVVAHFADVISKKYWLGLLDNQIMNTIEIAFSVAEIG